jgi:hypothetical protein
LSTTTDSTVTLNLNRPYIGLMQVPCIERCAFGAVKAWTAYAIASNALPLRPAAANQLPLDNV